MTAGGVTIGRVGIDTVNLGGFSSWKIDGDNITATGELFAATAAGALILRQQLNGLVNNTDEQVIPVTWVSDPTVNGWYQVTAASVDISAGSQLTAGFLPFSLTLKRFGRGYASPKVECYMSGSLRLQPSGTLIVPTTWHATPAAASVYDSGPGFIVPATRVGPGGNATVYVASSGSNSYYNATPTFLLPAANWYDMAATIKSAGNVVVGRQLISTPTDWELSNGLVKITPHASHLFDVFAPVYATPSTWGAARGLDIGWISAGPTFNTFGVALSMSVLRNSPEESVVRLTLVAAIGGGTGYVYVDISLRRGARMASVRVTASTPNVSLAMRFSAATACTVISGASAPAGGIRATSNDANANRALILSSATQTQDLTNGWVWATAAGPQHDMAVGHEVGGSSAVAPDTAANVRDQWFAAIAETQSVAAQ